MKPQHAVKRETGHIALGTLVQTAAMLIVFALIGKLDLKVLLGALYGSVLAVANFYFLGLTVQRIAEKAKPDDPDGLKLAKLRMRQSYMLRVLIGAGLLIVALAVFKLNWIGCFFPLVFPRITITAMDIFKRIRTIKGSGSEIK